MLVYCMSKKNVMQHEILLDKINIHVKHFEAKFRNVADNGTVWVR